MNIPEYTNYANMITCIFDHGMKDLCLSFYLCNMYDFCLFDMLFTKFLLTQILEIWMVNTFL